MRSEHALRVGDADLPLIVQRHPRARRLRLRFDAPTGTLKLTMPPRASLRSALAWVAEQRAWIEAQQVRQPGLVRLLPGAEVPIEGALVRIDWRADAPRAPALDEGSLRLGGPEAGVPGRVMRWLKERARTALTAETRALATRHALPLANVSIGDPRSRWGSCATDGSIRYSWRLILAPAHVRLATVAHEVAHLRHMDHSAAFHAYVAAISDVDPDAARAWLRREGRSLHRYMA